SSFPSKAVGVLTTLDAEIFTTAGMAAFAAGAIVTRLGVSFGSASFRLMCARDWMAAASSPPPSVIAHATASALFRKRKGFKRISFSLNGWRDAGAGTSAFIPVALGRCLYPPAFTDARVVKTY